MKLATLQGRGVVVRDGQCHSLPCSVTDLITLGLAQALEVCTHALTAPGMQFDDEELDAPFAPASIRDFVTFESHVEGIRRSVEGVAGVPDAWYDAPTFYFTNPHAIIGPHAKVRRPHGCSALDFELEVAAVLGTNGTSLTEAESRAAIFGYVIVNDWSARDLQAREMQVGLGPAKGKDFCTSIGPYLVTADELHDCEDPDGFLDLECTVSVNGSVVGSDRLSNMGWTFATMIAYASRDSRVVAGDLLASGTIGGGGCLAELWGRAGTRTPPPLEPGDLVTLTVDRLGSLTNTIVPGSLTPPLSSVRPPTRSS